MAGLVAMLLHRHALAQPSEPESPATHEGGGLSREEAQSHPDNETERQASPGPGEGKTPGAGMLERSGATRRAPAIGPAEAPPPLRSGPPPRLQSWTIEGKLIDSRATVHGLLVPLMQDGDSWSVDKQRDVREYLLRLGYHCQIQNQPTSSGGTRVTLDLHPVALVRHVEIDLQVGWAARAYQPIFADEIQRRMTLRPGSPLALDEASRSEQLQADAERLRNYLRNDGFYEATVQVTEHPEGQYASKLRVQVTPGPPYFVGQISVIGNTAIVDEKITRLFRHDRLCLFWKLCFGSKRFSRQQLNQDVEKLTHMYQKRGFPGVRVKTDFDVRHSFNRVSQTVEFSIEIRERRKIDVVFEGNSGGNTDARLTEELTLSDAGSYDDYEVEASAVAIRHYYQQRGHFEASVTWEREHFPDFNFERILFYIDEGPQLKIRDVRFVGNVSVSDRRLGTRVKTKIFKRLPLGETGGFATSLQLAQDVERIVEIYRQEGFRSTRVRLRVTREAELRGSAPALAAALASQRQASGLYVTFEISEGIRSLIDEVRFEHTGQESLKREDLRAATSLRRGAPFLQKQAEEDGEAVQRHYFSKGYPRAVVSTEVRPRKGRITVIHHITENSPAKVGKIALRGNFKTRDWVILQELRLREGQPLTVAAAERAQNNLRRSGLFGAVQINYLGREDPRQEVVNVLVRVEERHDSRAAIQASGGYSTDSKWFVETGVGSSNVGGIGAKLNTRFLYGISDFISLNREQLFLEAKLGLPRWILRKLLGTDILLDSTVSYRVLNVERFGDLTTIGGRLALSKEGRRGFFEDWLLSLRYDFRQRNRDVPLIRPAGNSDDIEEAKVTTRSSTVGPYLVVDKRRDREGRKNPLTPEKGYRLELSAVFAEDKLLGTNRFVKLGGALQHFISLGERLTLSNGLRYDHGVPLGGSSLLPEVERFFAGGDTTVRGFEEDRLATELVDSPLSPLGGSNQFRQFQVLPAGGNIRFIHNLDLQLRVWDDPWFDFPISSAIFIDTGLVTNSLVGLQVEDFRHSLGVALVRWILPLGSLSVEYALPLDPTLGDNPRGRFHLNLGVLY